MKNDSATILNLVAQTIYDKKGFNTLGLDVRGISNLTEYVIIAEGSADKHVMAIGSALIQALRQIGEAPLHVEGLSEGDWVVIDCLDLMIHLFMPGLRDKYQLEQLWKEGELLDLNISLSAEGSGSYTYN